MTEFSKKLISVAELNEATRGLINEESANKFMEFTSHMLKVNEVMNLTAIRDIDGVILKHIVDSCAIVPYIKENAKIADIGCGGGFPTFPIAILRGDVSILAVDSVTKKVDYVKSTKELFHLDKISVSNRRAEDLGKDKAYRESFDTVCARAVGRLNLLCELCIPLVRPGGVFIAMKSKTTDNELEEAKNAIELLGGFCERVINYTLTDGNETLERTMIIIRKQTLTPTKYPRNNSQISKKPL
ncbi:MAG: 16S rRNA (guanine(527)-N(7))-methyltransferase RsmG [Clostridia bacterium]|nr:16S rRNA (guanine(527)-N(7))-methyltransferase RsmG [Clostridia bacterium]